MRPFLDISMLAYHEYCTFHLGKIPMSYAQWVFSFPVFNDSYWPRIHPVELTVDLLEVIYLNE